MIYKHFLVLSRMLGLAALILLIPALSTAETGPKASQPAAAELYAEQAVEQYTKILNELRLIKREIAQLKQVQAKPGIKDLVAGVGFIFGLFGAAAFVASRRRQDNRKE